uniref:Uncharacterized protein n=1 Tax=viral metagenome TaxID=1070528 RepID=A0A6C0BC16_9ZZZZ
MSTFSDNESRQTILSILDPFRKNLELSTKSLDELKKILDSKTNELSDISHEQYNSILSKSSYISTPDDKSFLLLEKDRLLRWEQNLFKIEEQLKIKEAELTEREKKLRLSRSRSPSREPKQSSPGVKSPIPSYKEQLLPDTYQPYSGYGLIPGIPDQNLVRHEIYGGSSPVNQFIQGIIPPAYDEQEAIRLAIIASQQEAMNSLDSAQQRLIRKEKAEEIHKHESSIENIEENKADEKIKSKYNLEGRPLEATDEILDNLLVILKSNDQKEIRSHLATYNEKMIQWITKLKHEGSTFRQYLANNSKEIYKCIDPN